MQVTLKLTLRQVIDIEQLVAAHAADLAELFAADPCREITAAIERLKATETACQNVRR